MTREAALKVEADRVVALEFTLTDEEGEVLRSATTDDPLVYLHGRGAIPKALEDALEGREVAERFEMELSPEEFVGPRIEDAERAIPADSLPGGLEPRVGMQLDIDEDGDTFAVWITAIGESNLTVSLEHPWAGRSVKLVAEVLVVREATADELASGEPGGIE